MTDLSSQEMNVRTFGQRQIIEDYVGVLEDQEKQMDKHTLLRVIKSKQPTQEANINGYQEEWDGARSMTDYKKREKEEKKKK